MPDDHAPSEEPPPRRRFLRQLALASGVGALLAGCGGGSDGGNASPDSAGAASASTGNGENQCVPSSALSQEARQGRQRYGYVAQTPEQGKQCDNCQFWIPAEDGEACGGCRLFAGPVHPQGYCTAYVRG
jgi:hypothetical protein